MANGSTRRKFSQVMVDFIVDHPVRALFIGLAMMMVALPGGAYIAQDFSYRAWFDEDDPLLQQFDAFERRFGNDESIIVIMHSPSGIFDAESAGLLNELTEKMWRLPDVIRVDSLANYNWVHAQDDDIYVEPLLPKDTPLTAELLAQRKAVAQGHETLPNFLISNKEDDPAASTTVLYAALKPGIDAPIDYSVVVGGIEKLLAEVTEAEAASGGDHQFYFTGQPVISHSFRHYAQQDFMLLFPLTLLLTIVFLAFIFRRISGVILPLVIIGTTVMVTMTISGWLGMKINNLTVIVPQILLAIAIADSVHVLTTYFRALKQGATRKEAARISLKKNFQPTLVTSVSTALGFLSFSTAAVVTISQMGILTGIGTMVAWLMTYFILGPLLVLVRIKGRAATGELDMHRASPRGVALTRWLYRKRHGVLVGYIALCGVGGYFATQIDVNSDPISYFDEGSQLTQATHFIEKHLGGSIPIEVVIDSGEPEGFKDPAFLKKVEALQEWLGAKPYTTSTTSIVDVIKSTHKAMFGDDPEFYKLPETRGAVAELYLFYTMGLPAGMDLNDRVALKNDAIRMTANWDIHDSVGVIDAIEELEAKAKDMGLNAEVTGKVPIWQRMNPYVVNAFVVSLLLALGLMSLLLIIVFRSVPLGLLAMVPNGAPLVLGAGFIAAVGKSLDVGTVIIFSVCLGIAVDDTVHFLSSYNRLRREGHAPGESIARTFTHTGPALVFTTIILVVAFGIFMFASFVPNRYFGMMVAFILVLALGTDLTLLPSLLLRKGDAVGEGKAAS